LIVSSFNILENLENIKNLKYSEGGRSNAAVFFTYDNRYVIKTITRTERKAMIRSLKDYAKRIKDPSSRLVRILGMFRLKPVDKDFIIMENTLSDRQNALIFDIKGARHRHVDEEFDYSNLPEGRVLKDLNLEKSRLKLNLSPEEKDSLVSQINQDFDMLCKNNFMDYSLLIAFYNNKVKPQGRYDFNVNQSTYSISIIDFLQEFNIKKKSEKFFKRIFINKSKITSISPEIYQQRLSDYMINYF
jgi:1-phosphatidylinositol-4-phosphate 5-kinase